MTNSLSTAPDWFTNAVNQPRTDTYFNSHGASIHLQRWPTDTESTQGLLFVHGHAAHSHWWDFIAPAFSRQYQCGALDLSGNGDSDHRQLYSAEMYADEIMTAASQLGDNTVLVGHSFGGTMCRIANWLFPSNTGGLILADSFISNRKADHKAPPMPRIKDRVYPSLASGMLRFRLRPPQPCENRYIVDYIAAKSLRKTEAGYQFKLDPAVFAKMVAPEQPYPDAVSMLAGMSGNKAMIYGEQSRFFPSGSHEPLTQLFGQERVVKIESAHHHLFLDQPLAFIKGLQQLLDTFSSK